MRLDAKTIAALNLGGKTDVIYFDDALAGFGYRLRRAGPADGEIRRSWIAQYRRAGRTRRLLLGSAAVLTAEQARAAAKKVLARVALGEDPQADKSARRGKDRHTLGALIEDYLEQKRTTLRPSSFTNAALYLRGPYFKPLHGMPVDTIVRRDVAARLVAITRDHGSIVAARARSRLSAFFAWAMGHGLAEANPIIGTLKPEDSAPRERTLSDAELAAIWRASGDDAYGKVIKLLILTAARRGEVGGMRWSELDLEHAVWTIPPQRTKNKREHTLPLMPLALDVIASVPRRATRDHLFGSRSAEGLRHWHAKADLDRRLGEVTAPWRLHDLRRTAATRMADLGVQPHVIEAVLNHQSGTKRGVAGIYNRSSYQREVRAALALWADHVRTLVAGGERKVLPFIPQTLDATNGQ
ncbi:MAG TPA: site-specific integrase [Xanthobacteraceae bacterium]|nr:site-specific integrase [Xanthobacteraceae bacterium]